MSTLIENNRKFLAFCIVFGISVVLLFMEMLSDASFRDITIAVVGLYMAGNVGEHFARREQYVIESSRTTNPPGWGES